MKSIKLHLARGQIKPIQLQHTQAQVNANVADVAGMCGAYVAPCIQYAMKVVNIFLRSLYISDIRALFCNFHIFLPPLDMYAGPLRPAACFILAAANAYMALLSRRAQEVPQATAPECAALLQAVTTAR